MARSSTGSRVILAGRVLIWVGLALGVVALIGSGGASLGGAFVLALLLQIPGIVVQGIGRRIENREKDDNDRRLGSDLHS